MQNEDILKELFPAPSSEPEKHFQPNVKPDFTQAGIKYSLYEDVNTVRAAKEDSDKKFLDNLRQGIVDIRHEGGLNYTIDTSNPNNLSRDQYGDNSNDILARVDQSVGFGEENISKKKYRLDVYGDRGLNITADDMEASYGEMLGNAFKFGWGETNYDADYATMQATLLHKDAGWTPAKIQETIDNEIDENVKTLLDVGGVDYRVNLLSTNNRKHFEMVLFESVKNAMVNLQMKAYGETTGIFGSIGDTVGNMVQDPTMARDMIVSTVLTAGLAIPELVGARLATSGVAAARAGGATIQSIDKASRAFKLAQLSSKTLQAISPTTGLIEGAAYPVFRGALSGLIKGSNARTMAARALAAGTEGAVSGALGSIRDQRDEYEWKELLKPTGKPFEYNGKEILSGSVAGFGTAVLLMGAMRGVFGLIGGEGRLLKARNWNELGRRWANSFDTWAQTKDGLTVFGDALSDGRGMWFGNAIDKMMAKYVDNRTFADVMLNGHKLFNNFKFDPGIAAKQNFDDAGAIQIAERFEKLTGMPAEVMTEGLEGTERAGRVFTALIDPDVHAMAGLTPKDVSDVLDELIKSKEEMPIGMAGTAGLVESSARRQADTLDAIENVFEGVVQSKLLAKAGLEVNDVLDTLSKTLGRRVDQTTATDRENVRTAATFLLGVKNGQTVMNTLNEVLSGSNPIKGADGVELDGTKARDTLVAALGVAERGDTPLWITDGNFVLRVWNDADGKVKIIEEPSTLELVDGKVVSKSEAERFHPNYKPENIMSMERLGERLGEFKTKVDAELKKLRKAQRDAKKAGIAPDVVRDIGRIPTHKVLMKHFKLTAKEARVASIVMDAMGYDATDSIIKIARAKNIEEGATGDISIRNTKNGFKALIRTTEHSDFGTLVHEMAHYMRVMFVSDSPDSKEFRNKIGISDKSWEQFLDWVGNKENDWSGKNLVAEEKFANGFAFFIRNLMQGQVKAPTTGVQRLFVALGKHMGDVGLKMKTQSTLEEGLQFSDIAEEVYGKLISMNDDKLSVMFDSAYSHLFRTMSADDREVVGRTILGEASWENFKAQKQIKIEKAAAANNKAIAASAIPKVDVDAAVENIVSQTKASRVRTFIRKAVKDGHDQSAIIDYLDLVVSIGDGLDERNAAGLPVVNNEPLTGIVVDASPRTVAFLSDASIMHLMTRVDEPDLYVVVGHELDPKLSEVKPQLVRVSSQWLTELQDARKTRKAKAEQRLKELKETRAAMKAAEKARYVDASGVPVPLTETEKLAVEANERKVADVKSVETAAVNAAVAALNPETPIEAVASAARPVEEVRPEQINIEQVPEVSPASIQTVSQAVTNLARESTAAKSTLSPYEKELVDVSARILAQNPLALPNLYKFLQEQDTGTQRLSPELVAGLIDYIKIEARFLIAQNALQSITGQADLKSLEIYSRVSLAIAQLDDADIDRADIKAFARRLGVSESDVGIYDQTRREITRSARNIKNNLDMAFIQRTEASVAAGKVLDKKTQGMLDAAKNRVMRFSDDVADVSAIPAPEKPVTAGHIASAAEPPSSDMANMELLKSMPSLIPGLYKVLGKSKTSDVMLKLLNVGDLRGMLARICGLPEDTATLNDVKAVLDSWATDKPLPDGAPEIDMGLITATFKRIAKNAELDEFRKFGRKNLTGDGGREDGAPSRTADKVDESSVRLDRAMVWGNLLAGGFYNYMMTKGHKDIAEYFAVRRSTYFLKGDRVEIAKETFKVRYGDYAGKTKINQLESELRKYLLEYAEELELEGLDGASELLRQSLGKASKEDMFSVFASGKEFGEELVFNQKKLPGERLAELVTGEKVRNSKELDMMVMYRISSGIDVTVADSVRYIADSNRGWYSKLAKALLNSPGKDALESEAIFAMSPYGGTAGARYNIVNLVAISTDPKVKQATTVLHEAIHSITTDAIDLANPGLKDLTGLAYAEEVANTAIALKKSTDVAERAIGNLMHMYVRATDSIGVEDLSLLNKAMDIGDADYPLVDVGEMVAHALTDKAFAKQLVSLPPVASDPTPVDFLTAMTELLTRKKVSGTLLSNIAAAIDDIGTLGSTDLGFPSDLLAKTYEAGIPVEREMFRVIGGKSYTPLDFYGRDLDPRQVQADIANIAMDPHLEQVAKARANLKAAKGRQRQAVRLLNTIKFNQKVLKDSDVKVVGGQLGSNLAAQVEDMNGSKYYVKNQKTTLHAEVEVLAQKLYEMAGIKSVASEVYDTGLGGIPGPSLVTPWFTSKLNYNPSDENNVKAVHKAFIPACWLAHWDVCGLTKVENIDGNGVILDAGGSLLFRAQGQPKGSKFGNEVGELESLLNPSINATTAKAFAGLSHAEKVNQAKVLKGITDEMIDLAVDSHILSSKTEAANLKKTLKARRDYIYDKLVGPEIEAEKVSQDLYDEINAALGISDPLVLKDLPIEEHFSAVPVNVDADSLSYLEAAGLIDGNGYLANTEINLDDSSGKVWNVLKDYIQDNEINKVEKFKDLFVDVILDAYKNQYLVSKDNAILNALKKNLGTSSIVVNGKTVESKNTDINTTPFSPPSMLAKFFMLFPSGFEGMEGLPGEVSFKLPEDDLAKAQFIDKNIDSLSINDFWKNVEPLISDKKAFKTLVNKVAMYHIIDMAFTLQSEMTPIDAIKTAAKEVYGATVDTEKVKVSGDPPFAFKLSRVALVELYLSAFNEDPKVFFKNKQYEIASEPKPEAPTAGLDISVDEAYDIGKLFDPVEGLLKKLSEAPFKDAWSFQGKENKNLGRLRPGETLLPGLNKEQSELVLQIATSPRMFEFENAFPDILLLTRLVKENETLRTLVKAYLKERATLPKTELAGFKADTSGGYNIIDNARKFFDGAFQNGYPIDIAIRVFAGNLERADTKLFRVEAGKIPGIALEVFSGDSAADRKLAFQAFSTGKNGNDILVRDELGVPLKLVRAMTDTSMKELDTRADVSFRSTPRGAAKTTYRFFGEEDAQVADDYKDSNHPIVTGYLAVEPERLVRIKMSRPKEWTALVKSEVIEGIRNSKLSDYDKGTIIKKLADYGTMINIDAVAEILVGEGHADAISVDGTLDLLKSQRSGNLIPHTQWIVATEKNVFKSVTALKFETGGIPSYFTQKNIGPTGPRAIAIKEEADKLSAATETHRKALKSLGLSEEITPDEIDALSNLINGLPTGGLDIKTIAGAMGGNKPQRPLSKVPTKAWRALTVEERRLFLQDHIMPRISAVLGNRNQTAGVYSKLSDSVVGRKFNEMIAGAVSYGDVTDSQSQALQFLGKMLDPASDLRDGELGNAFYMPNMDQIHAEANNIMIESGLADVRQQMIQVARTPEEAEQINDLAWTYLANPENLPKDVPHRQVILNLINAQIAFNERAVKALQDAGLIGEGMDPKEYGTIRRADSAAYSDPEGFADALTEHAVQRTRDSKEISVLTCDAMGWLEIRRSGAGEDDILSITVPENSPLASLFDKKELGKKLDWNSKTRAKFANIDELSEDVRARHDKALVEVTDDYTEGWKKMYAGKLSGQRPHTAIRQAMTIARDRYLGYDLTDTKTVGPRQLSIGNGRNHLEERILSHREITSNPKLAKYFDKDLADLNYTLIRGQMTDALMTKRLTDFFGVRLTMSDLIEILRNAEASKDVKIDMAQMESRSRGFDRVRDAWNHNTGAIESSKDSLDKYYKSLLENSRVSVLLMSGLRAGVASSGEVTRAIFSSDKHRMMLTQALPNFVKLVQFAFSKNKRRAVQELTSATHWMRGLSTEHLLARADMHPENPFGGVVMGARQPGFFARFMQDWRAIGKINSRTSNPVTRVMNRVSMASKYLGGPLALLNDVTTTMHLWNLQRNLTENADNFMRLSDMLAKNSPRTVSEFKALAKKAGLTHREAIALSTQGLLDPKYVRLMVQAAKDQRNFTDGMLDVRKLYRWAKDNEDRLETISRMGGFVNMTARETNADPTLLDIRIGQSPYAKALNVFQQFLLSHSVQEIGRRRRWGTMDYSKHLIGLVAMEMMVTSLLNAYNSDTGEWEWTEAQEDPIEFIISSAIRMPLLGGYQWLTSILTPLVLWGKDLVSGEEADETNISLPSVMDAPANRAPRNAWNTVTGMLED